MRKELIELRQDPRLFGIVILAPILQLTILGYAATTDVKDVPMVVVDADRSVASRELLSRFEASDNFSIVGVGRIDRRHRPLARGRPGVDGAQHSARLRRPHRARRDGQHPGRRGRQRLEFNQCRARLRARADRRLLGGADRPPNGRARAGAAGIDASGPRLVQSGSREPRLHDPGHRRAAPAAW